MKKSFYFVTFSPVLKHCSRISFFVVTLSSTDCLSHLQVLNPLYWNEEWTIYLLATLLGTIARPPFSFRTAIILCGTDSTRCWKHSSDILVHFDMTVSHIYRRFFWLHIHDEVQSLPKGALLDCDLVTMGAIWVQWVHWDVQPLWDDVIFVIWCVALLKEATSRWL